jgi:hypothetical protein
LIAEESDDAILIVFSELCKKESSSLQYIDKMFLNTHKDLIIEDCETTLS